MEVELQLPLLHRRRRRGLWVHLYVQKCDLVWLFSFRMKGNDRGGGKGYGHPLGSDDDDDDDGGGLLLYPHRVS